MNQHGIVHQDHNDHSSEWDGPVLAHHETTVHHEFSCTPLGSIEDQDKEDGRYHYAHSVKSADQWQNDNVSTPQAMHTGLGQVASCADSEVSNMSDRAKPDLLT